MFGSLRSLVQQLAALLAGFSVDRGLPKAQNNSLIKVSAIRARVLCQKCHGEHDEAFKFCQFCGKPWIVEERDVTLTMHVDEKAIDKRAEQFHAAVAALASVRSRNQSTDLFNRFLGSRVGKGAKHMAAAQPTDILEFLCWLDSCGERRRTIVHDVHCESVGTETFTEACKARGLCGKRFAHDSLRTNYVSKLAVAYERDLGVAPAWCDQLRVGNPVRSDIVTQYMAFSRSEQKRAGVRVKQAPALLHSHLASIVAPLRARLQGTVDLAERLTLARNIALFTVAFSTTKRGDELTRTLIQRILRLPNHCGFLLNFQWGKTMRDGADHLLTIPYDAQHADTCPVRAIERWIEVGNFAGWDMGKGYLFPVISMSDGNNTPVRGSRLLSASQMTALLKQSASAAGVQGDFSMHSFRSGGAVSRALAGDDLSTIMQRAFWKNPKTAWRYMQLAQVVSPGSSGYSMVPGVTEHQYRLINEFPLSEQSRSWAAFGNEPMM